MLPEAITLRGEMISLFVAALVLMLAVRPVAALTGLTRSLVGDLFWSAGVAFVLVGHAAYLLFAAPGSLLDPFVLIRVQSGLEPLAGVAGVAVAWWWYTRERPAARAWSAVAIVTALVLATVAYDASCVLRDACYGVPAPAPLGFPMAGLADTRVATPLVEAAALLALLALAVRAWPRLGALALAGWMVAGLALLRVALIPLSVAGRDGFDARAVLTLVIGLGALAVAVTHSRALRSGARDPRAAG